MSSRYQLVNERDGASSHERGASTVSTQREGGGDSFTHFLASRQQQHNAGPATQSAAGSKWVSASNNADHHSSLGTTSLVVNLRAKVAELEYELAVTADRLGDVTRERDQLQTQLSHLSAAANARHEVQRTLDVPHPTNMSLEAARISAQGPSSNVTLNDISRASNRFVALSGQSTNRDGSATDVAESMYTLQRDFARLSEECRKKDGEIARLTQTVSRLQDGMSNEVNKSVFEVEKELVRLRRELAEERAQNKQQRQEGVLLDALLRENFNLEDMSQNVSHSILIPSDALFHRLRTDHRRNNFLSSKYDVSVEFTAAAGRSIVLRGKRLNVELLKGEIYAVLNEMHSAKIAGGGALDIVAARSGGGNGVGGLNSSSGIGAGNTTDTGSILSVGASNLTAAQRGRRSGQGDEVNHLCSTITTHEATIEVLHTAVRHAQEKAHAADVEAKRCRDARDEFEEKAKNAEILKKARESELGHRIQLLEKQLLHAQEANKRAIHNASEESHITQQYREENEKLREEIAELLESKEVAERSCYVAHEHSKLLSAKEQEATRAAATALADRTHVERLSQQLEDARRGRDEMVERLAKEAGELKQELKAVEELGESHRKDAIEARLALETAEHEVGVHKELVEELRHRLIKLIHAQGNGTLTPGGGAQRRDAETSELLRKSATVLPATAAGAPSRQTLSSAYLHGGSDPAFSSGLVGTPRAGGGVTSANNKGHMQLATDGASSDAVVLDRLFLENDTLKRELERSHDEIREVAHSLKETRHIRELTARELEKLQKQRSQWGEEKTVLQRTRMEEQLVARQVQAELEMKLATNEESLAQVKKRADILHEQLLREQRNAHEALMRAESAETAMASMHRELSRRDSGPSGVPSGAASAAGSTKPHEIRRPPHTKLGTVPSEAAQQQNNPNAATVPPPSSSATSSKRQPNLHQSVRQSQSVPSTPKMKEELTPALCDEVAMGAGSTFLGPSGTAIYSPEGRHDDDAAAAPSSISADDVQRPLVSSMYELPPSSEFPPPTRPSQDVDRPSLETILAKYKTNDSTAAMSSNLRRPEGGTPHLPTSSTTRKTTLSEIADDRDVLFSRHEAVRTATTTTNESDDPPSPMPSAKAPLGRRPQQFFNYPKTGSGL